MHFVFASSKAKVKAEQIAFTREMAIFVEKPPPQIHVEFRKLRGWPEGIDSTFARKVLHRAYLDAGTNP
jgi:hypothetical protein